jgi:hypothetical protein
MAGFFDGTMGSDPEHQKFPHRWLDTRANSQPSLCDEPSQSSVTPIAEDFIYLYHDVRRPPCDSIFFDALSCDFLLLFR